MEQKAISSDLIRGHIDTIILHTLLTGDKFAQQISDSIEEKSGKEYKINQATLYSSLKRLESLKYVTSYWYDSVGGRRKYFKLTDAGNKTVDSNMESWSYSRTIIDKLMDCEPIYQTKIIEKVVEIPVVQRNTTNDSPILVETSTKPIPTTSVKSNQILSNTTTDEKPQENTQELNFRNILSGLIKSSVAQKTQVQELQPINKQKSNEIIKDNSSDEKLKFNETIKTTDYNSQKTIGNTGKIDFGDLIIKSSKEGYKLRISSKDSGVAPGRFLISKLNLFASLAIYIVALLEFLYLTSVFRNNLNLSAIAVLGTIVILSVFPLIRLVTFLKNPERKTPNGMSADKILTAAIIVFNLLIVTLAANLLFNVDFSDTSIILLSFVIPCIIYVDILLYCIIKYIIGKFPAVNIYKKTA